MSDQQKFSEPSFVLTYCPSGWGKTVDCLYSFPEALFIAAPGALKPWLNVVGLPFEPANAPGVKTIMQATAIIQREAPKRKWNAIVLDDFSLLCEASFNEIEKAGKPGLQFWGRVRDALLDFRGAARECGMHVILNAHERGPHNDEKKGYVRGGPMLPGTMPEDLPKSCDMVLRVVREPAYPGWPVVYSGKEGDPDYVEKDRHGFIPSTKVAPMNLGELMRRGFGTEGPFGIRRPRGLEWMEKVVTQITAQLGKTVPGSEDQKALLRGFRPLIEAKYTKNPLHVRWVFRDAIARAALNAAHDNDTLSTYL